VLATWVMAAAGLTLDPKSPQLIRDKAGDVVVSDISTCETDIAA
jgi:hypothetical protein